jgi:hypothetical protein
MANTRPFDPALFDDAAIDAETAKLNSEMIQLLTGSRNGGCSSYRYPARNRGST